MRTSKKIHITLIASGSEVGLAINVGHKLATEKIYSKIISMPSHELFDSQTKGYKDKILNETKYLFTIEAGSSDIWQKYIKNKGLCFGINDFGKSAPYKEIYNYYNLNDLKIINKIKTILKN